MKKILLSIFVFLIATGMFIGNYQFAKKYPGGSDFLYRWLPTHLLVTQGYDNPYSTEVEHLVEIAHYGHPYTGKAGETPGIFAYPYYIIIFLLPLAWIENFTVARAIWMTLLEAAHIGIVFLSAKMIRLKASKQTLTVILLTSLLATEFIQAIIDGNPSSLASLFIFLTLYAIQQNRDTTSGILLALSTIKPQLALLFFVLIYWWAFSNSRWKIIRSSLLTLVLLLSGSFLIQPTWFTEFLRDVFLYPNIASPSTPKNILSYWMPTNIAHLLASILSLASLAFLAWGFKWVYKNNFCTLLVMSALIFVVLPFTGLTSAKSNYIPMLLAIVLMIKWALEYKHVSERVIQILLLLWIPISWLTLIAGRTLYIKGHLIYFLDFYPLPILLILLFYFGFFPSWNADSFCKSSVPD